MYRLRLLGGASVERLDGTPITGPVAQRHRVALLALLACGSVRGREKLMALLWPERDPERARNLLNVAVYALRKGLGDDTLRTAGEELRLNPDVVQADVVEFKLALDREDHAAAVALYGGPLLDGFFVADAPELERWIEAERERLAAAYGRALDALARAAEGRRDFAAAAEWWRRRAAHDPYDSRVTQDLVRCLEGSGNRAAALQHALAHERLLRDELGIASSGELVAMVARLRASTMGTPPHAEPHDPGGSTAASDGVATSGASLAAPASGRDTVPVETGASTAPAHSAPEGPPRIRRWPLALGFALMVVVVTALGWRARTSAAVPDRSVAVLPFTNIGADTAVEYFSDGVTEEIITRLSAEPQLKVISRTSAMRYKGSTKPLRQIATELGVTHVLEGSVRREGPHLRITAQLIDAGTDTHLWSETFDRGLGDVFAVQEEIAREVSRALELRLADGTRSLKRGTRDPGAYELHLRARYLWHRRTREGHLQAAEYFRRAIARDSTYADAWSGLSDTYLTAFQANYFGFARPEVETFAMMRTAAERAVALDPQSAEAHTSLASVRWWQKDFPAAERELRRAITLNPGYALPHAWYAVLLRGTGRAEEAVRESRRAVELDPFAVVTNESHVGALIVARRWDECVAQARRGFEVDPGSAGLHQAVGTCLALSGHAPEAVTALRAAVAADPEQRDSRALLAWAQALAGHSDDARSTLRVVEAMPRESNDIGIAFAIGRAYVALGERDSAFAWLDRAEWKWPHLNNLYDPSLDPLRADPRFTALAARVSHELRLQ